MPTLSGDPDAFAKSTIGSYASKGIIYNEFIKKYSKDWNLSFEQQVRTLGFRDGREALKSSSAFEFVGEVVRIRMTSENAHIIKALDNSKPKPKPKKTRRASPVRYIASGGNIYTASSSGTRNTNKVPLSTTGMKSFGQPNNYSNYNNNSNGYSNNRHSQKDMVLNPYADEFDDYQAYNSNGSRYNSTTQNDYSRDYQNTNNSNNDSRYAYPDTERSRRDYEPDNNDQSYQDSSQRFNRQANGYSNNNNNDDYYPQYSNSRSVYPTSASRQQTPQPGTSNFTARAPANRSNQLDAIESAVIHEGIPIFNTDIQHVSSAGIKNLDSLFRDIETHGSSNNLSFLDVQTILDYYHMGNLMNMHKFAALFSFLRPEWNVVVDGATLVFTETGKARKPIYELFAESRRIPKHTCTDGSCAMGYIIAVDPNLTIYVRLKETINDYLHLKQQLRDYTLLFNENLEKNLKDRVTVIFLADFVLWYDEDLGTFLRCQVRAIKSQGNCLLNCVDEGRSVTANVLDLFPLPRKFRKHPPFCINFEACNSDQTPLRQQDCAMLEKIANNMVMNKKECTFSFLNRKDNNIFPDLYRGVWKPKQTST
ncbi:hypothetical protein M3Y95_01111800 [Aphelenchoides besseyi]|nr:hypothetical protein M3Y95_01111800 [Aphelenchoides besseyi]